MNTYTIYFPLDVNFIKSYTPPHPFENEELKGFPSYLPDYPCNKIQSVKSKKRDFRHSNSQDIQLPLPS